MTEFTYGCSTKIEFGIGAVKRLPRLLQDNGFGRRLFVVTDEGIVKAGIAGEIETLLKAHGYTVTRFANVKPNPRDVDCMEGTQLFRERWCDAIVAIGGGSAMDTAKTIALLGRHGGEPKDYADGERAYADICPLACIPTTAGTGSEVTRGAVITEASTHRKMTLKHEWLRPTLAVLDAELTTSVPRHITAATGVDALVHAIEGYTCRKSHPIAQAFGAKAMPLIFRALPKAYREPDNLAARADMLLGSLLAGLCFGSTDVASVHCLAEALGGLYDTPHGIANAVFLLPVLRYNVETSEALHKDVAVHLGVALPTDEADAAVQKLINALASWLQQLEIPSLSSLPGVKAEDADEIVRLAMANGSTPSNVRQMTPAAYREIFDLAMKTS